MKTHHLIYVLFISLFSFFSIQKAHAATSDFYAVYYSPTKANVLRVLDKMGVDFEIDEEGDVFYVMNEKGWRGYIIFQNLGQNNTLWSIQMRSQLATKASYYTELLDYANEWNANNIMPKVAMKNRSKMVLSFNYPIQFGFNPKEFRVNVFELFNRMAEKVGSDINDMRR